MQKKAILVITDGIGFNEKSEWNAFAHAKKPAYEWLFKNAPHGMISTFGTDIGLPEGQMGNSEVGHMCMGAGRVLYQDLVKISRAIENGELKNSTVLRAFADSLHSVHLCGLISDGGVHSHISHMFGLAEILRDLGKRVWIHAITDGRDIPPHTAQKFVEMILERESSDFKLATICGRFYAMDRDNRWERIKIAYDTIANAANRVDSSPLEYLNAQFSEGVTDEFIQPACFGDFQGIQKNEGFLFFNFRSDHARIHTNSQGLRFFASHFALRSE